MLRFPFRWIYDFHREKNRRGTSKLLKHMKKCELINTFVGSLVILIKHICVAKLVIFTNIWILLPGWPPVIFANISPIRLVKLVDVWWRSMPPERELSLPVSTGWCLSHPCFFFIHITRLVPFWSIRLRSRVMKISNTRTISCHFLFQVWSPHGRLGGEWSWC